MRGKKKDDNVQEIGSFFNHMIYDGSNKLPKKIAIGLDDHLSRLHRGFYLENMRRPKQTEATKMAHEVVDDHFAGVQRTLKKAKFTSKSGVPVKVTHFEHTRENPYGMYTPMGQAMRKVEGPGSEPSDGRHLVVHVDHHSTGVYNINNDHAHARHIEKHLKAITGHDWLFSSSMTHPDIDRGDNDGGGDKRDDDGGPDEPTPIVPTGPRTKQPQLV